MDVHQKNRRILYLLELVILLLSPEKVQSFVCQKHFALLPIVKPFNIIHKKHPLTSHKITRLHSSSKETQWGNATSTDVSLYKINEDEENSRKISLNTSTIVLFGIQLTPEILAIMTIYFVEGALGLARLAQTFYLKDTLHLGPAEMAAVTGLFTIPWAIKPLYGFLSDGFPLWGYRRRSYLILAGFVGFFCYAALGTNLFGIVPPQYQVQGTIAAFILSSASIAFSDVVADGIVVQRTRDSTDPAIAGGLQSLCWGSAAVGGLVSAYFSGSLVEVVGAQQVFAITSILPVFVAAIALAIDETPAIVKDKQENIRGIQTQVQTLWSAMQLPSVWRPALFLFLWQATPTSESAFFYFLTNDLGMGPEFFGRVRLITAAAGLLGVWTYQNYWRNVPIKDILFWTTIASTPLGLSQLLLVTHLNRSLLGIPDGAFVFGDDVALTILGQLAFLPTLVLAARICPPGVEAVLFATLMSIFNGASAVGTELGAALTKIMGVTETNFDNLAMLLVVCNVSSLFPLFFFGLIDDVGSQSEEEMIQSEQKGVPDVVLISSQKDIIIPDNHA